MQRLAMVMACAIALAASSANAQWQLLFGDDSDSASHLYNVDYTPDETLFIGVWAEWLGAPTTLSGYEIYFGHYDTGDPDEGGFEDAPLNISDGFGPGIGDATWHNATNWNVFDPGPENPQFLDNQNQFPEPVLQGDRRQLGTLELLIFEDSEIVVEPFAGVLLEYAGGDFYYPEFMLDTSVLSIGNSASIIAWQSSFDVDDGYWTELPHWTGGNLPGENDTIRFAANAHQHTNWVFDVDIVDLTNNGTDRIVDTIIVDDDTRILSTYNTEGVAPNSLRAYELIVSQDARFNSAFLELVRVNTHIEHNVQVGQGSDGALNIVDCTLHVGDKDESEYNGVMHVGGSLNDGPSYTNATVRIAWQGQLNVAGNLYLYETATLEFSGNWQANVNKLTLGWNADPHGNVQELGTLHNQGTITSDTQDVNIKGNIQNEGIIAPGDLGNPTDTSTWHLYGNLDLMPEGEVQLNIVDANNHDALRVLSTLLFNEGQPGDLPLIQVFFNQGYNPSAGDRFDLLFAYMIGFEDDTLTAEDVVNLNNAPLLPAGWNYEIGIDGTTGNWNLYVEVVPEPATLLLITIGSVITLRRRAHDLSGRV